MVLDVDCALYSTQSTGEHHKKPIAHRLDLATQMEGQERSNDLLLFIPKLQRIRLVGLSGGCRADHIGKHYCRESALAFSQRDLRKSSGWLSINSCKENRSLDFS